MDADEIIKELGYTDSEENWITDASNNPALASLFRKAKEAGAKGAYVFRTSPQDDPILPPRPAVFVASAADEDEARKIHRLLWNLGNAPFLIVVLPNQIRVYTGFNFDNQWEEKEQGWLGTIDEPTADNIRNKLADFYAHEIDTGRIWKTKAPALASDKRVNHRLLANLQTLGKQLIENHGLRTDVANRLIGKYIYIRYLKDRGILSPKWLEANGIEPDSVVSRKATLVGLRRLTEALDEKFNGKIFPLDFDSDDAPNDEAVRFVASVLNGDETSGQMILDLDFRVYDFSYLPIALLSSVYEQFLNTEQKAKEEGIVYTPEFLAEYLLCEMTSVKPLQLGMKILDPCCGSGIFLVLAYRRLIEIAKTEWRRDTLTPSELRQILTESIFGVEPSSDACYVAEFSLILTLLSNMKTGDLDHFTDFKLPTLHDENIFECDFFDDKSLFWKKTLAFDWVVGNPPWNELKPVEEGKKDKQPFIRKWMAASSSDRPIGHKRISEAFSWRVTDRLLPDGQAGLLVHAMSLVNTKSAPYRRDFFRQHVVHRITNFTNLAYVLFPKIQSVQTNPVSLPGSRPSGDQIPNSYTRSQSPAASLIYSKTTSDEAKPYILHYGPFVSDQALLPAQVRNKEAWNITIFENDIQKVDPIEAEAGEAITWKLALWGTYRDKRAIARLKRLFPITLGELAKQKKWSFGVGLQFSANKEGYEDDARLKELPQLDASLAGTSGQRFSVPDDAIISIPEEHRFVVSGSKAGWELVSAPHIFVRVTADGGSFALYSDKDFILSKPNIGIACHTEDANYLRAISIWIGSSVAQYLLFFGSTSWGFSRTRLIPSDVAGIPMPIFSAEQVIQLARLHRKISEIEIASTQSSGKVPNEVRTTLQVRLDEEVENIFHIPQRLGVLAKEFLQIRLQTNKGKTNGRAMQPPNEPHLRDYANALTDELDGFVDDGETRHHVYIQAYRDLILSTVKIGSAENRFEPEIQIFQEEDAPSNITCLWQTSKQYISQWVYVQRGLRIFDGPKVYLVKAPRLLDWTRTQAMLDADDIIGEVLNNTWISK